MIISVLLAYSNTEVIITYRHHSHRLTLYMADVCTELYSCELVLNPDRHDIDSYVISIPSHKYEGSNVPIDYSDLHWVDNRESAKGNGLYVYGAELQELIDYVYATKFLLSSSGDDNIVHNIQYGKIHLSNSQDRDKEMVTAIYSLIQKATNAFDPVINYHNSNHDNDAFMNTLRSFAS